MEHILSCKIILAVYSNIWLSEGLMVTCGKEDITVGYLPEFGDERRDPARARARRKQQLPGDQQVHTKQAELSDRFYTSDQLQTGISQYIRYAFIISSATSKWEIHKPCTPLYPLSLTITILRISSKKKGQKL